MSKHCKLGIIGYGYLGSSVHKALADTDIDVACIYNRSKEKLKDVDGPMTTSDMTTFIEAAAELDIVVELSHPDISKDHGESIIKVADYIPCSVGALADDELRNALLAAASTAGHRLLVPHGAVVGIDNLYEARDNWQGVTITFRKPPQSIDLDRELEEDETILFDGTVREIAAKFPRNVNAMVACALATVGLDTARARFIADRRLDGRLRGEFEFHGKDGSLLTVIKEEPAAGVSSPGIVWAMLGSIQRAANISGEGLNFV